MSDNNSEASTFRPSNYAASLIDLTEERDDPPFSANTNNGVYNAQQHQRGMSTYFNELVGLRMGRGAPVPDSKHLTDEELQVQRQLGIHLTARLTGVQGCKDRVGIRRQQDDEEEDEEDGDRMTQGDGYVSYNEDDDVDENTLKQQQEMSDASVESDNAPEHSALPAAKPSNLLPADFKETNRLLQILVNSQNGMCTSIADLASFVKELVLLQTMNKNITPTHIRLAAVNAEAIKDAINDESKKNIIKTTPSHDNSNDHHATLNKLNKTIEDIQHDHTTSLEALTLRIEELELDRAILRKRITVLEGTKKDGSGKDVSNNRLDKLEKMVKLEHKGMSHRIEVCEQQQGRSLNRLINNREGLEKVRERVGKLEEVVRKSAGSLEDGRQKGPKPGEWW